MRLFRTLSKDTIVLSLILEPLTILRGLKEGVKIESLWYNLRSPTVQSYSTAYEQAKRDIEIDEEKMTRIKTDQLEGFRRNEKKVIAESRPIK